MRVVKKPEERKAEMVAAAAKLFAQQGFVRTSVSEIVPPPWTLPKGCSIITSPPKTIW